jgi:hypothetical protein
VSQVRILASKSVPFRPMTVQMPNLALIETKRITVFLLYTEHKVRTYKEYHSVCPASELGLSQPLSRQRVFPSPQKQGGGGDTSLRVGGWGGVPIPTKGIHCGTLYMYVLCDTEVRYAQREKREEAIYGCVS